MKKILIFISLLVLAVSVNAQFPNTATQNNTNTLFKPLGGVTAGVGFILTNYADSNAANAINYLKSYPGATFFSIADNAIMVRNLTATGWLKNSTGSTGVTSVGLTVTSPSNPAFSISNSPITTSGNIALNLLGTTGQYIRGDGSLATTPVLTNEWHLTGNSGTNVSSNFIGTTDNVGLKFKTNNIQSGYIDIAHDNISMGTSTLLSNTSGTDNTAFGTETLPANTSGSANSAFGRHALLANETGSNNIGIGAYAGANVVRLSNRLYINSMNYDTDEKDTTQSIIYGAQDATAANQRLYLNSKIYAPYIPSGVGDKSVRYNSTTKEFTYADTTTGGGSWLLASGGTLTGNNIVQGNATYNLVIDSLSNGSYIRAKDGTDEYKMGLDDGAYFVGRDLVTGNYADIGVYTGLAKMDVVNSNNYASYVDVRLDSVILHSLGTDLGVGGSDIILDSSSIRFGTIGTQRMVLNNAGKLGIGTSSPDSTLHVVGGFKYANGSQANGYVLTSDANGGATWAAASGGGLTVGTTTITSGTNTRIGYNNSGVYGEYAITGTGNVAMSASPTFTGTVNGADANFTGLFSVGANPLGTDIAASKSGLNIYYNTTSTTVPVSLLMGTTAAFSKSLRFQAYPASYSTSGMEIADNGALFSVGMPFNVGTYTNHASDFWTNNVRRGGISGSGAVDFTGAMRLSNYGAGTATFDASGNITSVSDERLKTAIKPYTSGLKQLLLLKPIQYKWNEKSGNETKETYAGFSAQNVKNAIPYGTGENKDGYLSLQERAIVATLVNAVKEQQQMIDELKREIIKLQQKLKYY